MNSHYLMLKLFVVDYLVKKTLIGFHKTFWVYHHGFSRTQNINKNQPVFKMHQRISLSTGSISKLSAESFKKKAGFIRATKD